MCTVEPWAFKRGGKVEGGRMRAGEHKKGDVWWCGVLGCVLEVVCLIIGESQHTLRYLRIRTVSFL